MNVWIFNHYALPPGSAGGTRHHSLARALDQRGHQVTLVASSFDHSSRSDAHLSPGQGHKLEVVDGVRILWVRTPPYSGNTIARLRNMVHFALSSSRVSPRAIPERPSVVIGSSPHLFAAYAAARIASRFGVPFVLEVRDLWPQSLVDLGGISPSHPLILVLGHLEKSLYRRATRIISLLPNASEYISSRTPHAAAVVHIPNGVDLKLVPDPTPPPASDEFVVAYTGAHGLANGLDVVLDAAALLQRTPAGSGISLWLVGDGPEKPRLQQKASNLGLKNLTFFDPVPKRQIYDLLAQTGAGIVTLLDAPTFKWGVSPNKLFDYMAAARPVIFCVNTPSSAVDDARAGFNVPPGDPAALAAALIQIGTLPQEERWAMGLRGRKFVEEHHNLDRLALRLEAVLEEAIANHTSR